MVACPQAISQLRQDLGLNDPLPIQYRRYVANLLRGDLGVSTRASLSLTKSPRASRDGSTRRPAMIVMLFFHPAQCHLRASRQVDRILMGGAVLLDAQLPAQHPYHLSLRSICTICPHPARQRVAFWCLGSHSALVHLAIGLVSFTHRPFTLEILGQNYITAYSRAQRSTVMSRHMLPNTLISHLFALQFAGMLGHHRHRNDFAWPGIGPWRSTRLRLSGRHGHDACFSAVYIIMNDCRCHLPRLSTRIRLS